MNTESRQLFKTLRMPVFPMSLNAVALGSLAVMIFWLVTWVACQAAGDLGVNASVDQFLPSFLALVLGGVWPAGSQGWIFGTQLVLAFGLWATFGLAICRILVLRIARDDVCPLGQALGYAWKVKLTALLYPVAIALPVLFLAACNGAAGWISSIPYLGWLLGILLLPLVMISSVLIVLAVLVGLISLGFIPAIIAVERKGTFDATGKATNTITARPLSVLLHLTLMYVFIVVVVHGLLIQDDLIRVVTGRTLVPFGHTDFERIVLGDAESLSGLANWLAWICTGLWKLLHVGLWGLVISLTFGGFTSIFLILRQDVDGIEPEDVAADCEAETEDAKPPAAAPPMDTPEPEQ